MQVPESGGGHTRGDKEDTVVEGLPELTSDDTSDDEELEDDGRYKNQSYENGTQRRSNYAALLGPQVRFFGIS